MSKKQIPVALLLLMMFFFTYLNGISQGTIKGNIFDKETFQPVENVTVNLLNRNTHVHSNEKGFFLIKNIRNGDTLSLNHLGYEQKFIVVKNIDTTIQVFLAREVLKINEVTISARLKQINSISNIDLAVKPVTTAQEILRKVPGLFISQHAGGGKAEQIFLRGIDNDHGTDINISVDGIPVNMVSHAHGQGYADCHFIIPEIIKKIDFGKGPYYTGKGNFTTSGYVSYKTADKIEKNKISIEPGQFNTLRTVGLYNLLNNQNQSAYLATEYFLSDGPFGAPQNFHRINIFGKYHALLGSKNFLTIVASNFNSKWDASGQIPERAVANNIISRFGQIETAEGGQTARTNISFKHTCILDSKKYIENLVFFTKYDFELYSNFTLFLNDSVNGDLIRQKEKRTIYGYSSIYHHQIDWGNVHLKLSTGIGSRLDYIFNDELSHTKGRLITLEQKALGDIVEANEYGFSDWKMEIDKWLINAGCRVDYFKFNYNDKLQENYKTQSVQSALVSPKFNIIFSPNSTIQFYLKSGKGFHSNDTRVVVVEKGKEILPAVYGADLGFISKSFNKIIVNMSLWYLFKEQEFVYVGDEAVVEAGGRTRRYGADFSIRFGITPKVYSLVDVNYAVPRFIDLPAGENYIPLAPVFTSTGGLYFKNVKNFSGGINYRY